MPRVSARTAFRAGTRTGLRTLGATLAACALGLALAQGAHAAQAPQVAQAAQAGTLGAPFAGTAAAPAAVASKDNPFQWMELENLRAEQRQMCPVGNCVDYWTLVLDEKTASRPYSGGAFFLYAPATGDFGWFVNTDIATRTVEDPYEVSIPDSYFLRSHPRVEVRYGDVDHPERARVVATATTLMR
ncbi:hypothetical protein [Streptomyces sp. URMC 123]|uniref:hypothetical protein n=1 Tax=Streptomyces sp. URMC 123 TaxID=3423403 RepID=UPI003F1BAADC